jgi:diguanylate cyclase (GGDEF)-like protein
MPGKAKKTELQAHPAPGRGQRARNLEGVKGRAPAEVPTTALSRLLAELEELKKELIVAQSHVVELENKAHEDALLPVLNRRGFDRELERTLAYIKRHGTDVSLIYIDLDDFKDVNDIHGHAAGDAALLHIADILIANLRRSDVVARLGGDEFAILLHRADSEAACLKADQLGRALVSSALIYGGKEIPMSLTSGVTQLRRSDTCAAALARADKLMYEEKTRRKKAVPKDQA